MLREDVFGTIGMALFDLFVVILAIIFFSESFVPVWVGLIATVVFGCIAIWGTYKICKYWLNKNKKKTK